MGVFVFHDFTLKIATDVYSAGKYVHCKSTASTGKYALLKSLGGKSPLVLVFHQISCVSKRTHWIDHSVHKKNFNLWPLELCLTGIFLVSCNSDGIPLGTLDVSQEVVTKSCSHPGLELACCSDVSHVKTPKFSSRTGFQNGHTEWLRSSAFCPSASKNSEYI